MLRLILLSCALGLTANADNIYSKNAGQGFTSLPTAQKGGTLYVRMAGNPKVLNPLINHDVDVRNILDGMVFAYLMHPDKDSTEYFPSLAEKLDVSKDRKTYTYTIRKEAVWEDGTPVTTDDVEFSYKMMWDDKVDAAPARAFIGPFKFEKVDKQTFKYIVENPNINTVRNFNEIVMMQKKQYEGVTDFNSSKGIMQPVGNGPYKFKSFTRDQKIEFERNKDWWGYKIPQYKNLYNFDNIVVRVIPDAALGYERFIKGEIDIIEMNAEMFGTKVKGIDKDKFGRGPNTGKSIWAEHYRTDAPAIWTFIGWNNKNPLFASKKTRQALAHLIDYNEIISKAYHDEAIRSLSPFGTSTPNTAPDMKSKAFKFDIAKGIKLLKEDGWKDNGANQLVKNINGKDMPFEFTIKYNSENIMRSKIAQMVKEQFKKAGITVKVQALEWNSLTTDVDNRNYEAMVFGWGKGSIYPDPNQLWHSKSYENKGSNLVGYSNPEVDKMIADVLKEMDLKKRFKMMQKIGAMIYDDQPYAFLIEVPGFMMGVQSKIKSKKWYMKYDDAPAHWMYSAQ